ncbi:hypothetical protein [Pseudomonas azotoformans]|uniref:hypothetical protein n=1 Tax=Pseudomonas azotoformans TaxID=47878 RepID=UPI0012E78ED4|nr:hypothetical protein [Pseudomonas azotoformans]
MAASEKIKPFALRMIVKYAGGVLIGQVTKASKTTGPSEVRIKRSLKKYNSP